MATVQRITRTENMGDSPLDEQILPQFAFAELELLRSTVELLLTQIACSGGKYVVGVASDQTNGTDDHYQNHGQHHCVLSNVLAFLLRPELAEKMSHIDTPVKGSIVFKIAHLCSFLKQKLVAQNYVDQRTMNLHRADSIFRAPKIR